MFCPPYNPCAICLPNYQGGIALDTPDEERESVNPDRHTCGDCKREWIASNPNRNVRGKTVCTLCLTKNSED